MQRWYALAEMTHTSNSVNTSHANHANHVTNSQSTQRTSETIESKPKPAPNAAIGLVPVGLVQPGQVLLRICRIRPLAKLPSYQTAGAAGFDVSACLENANQEASTTTIAPGGIVAVPTGLSMEIPFGYEGQVRPRSGLATKFGVTVVNAPGTIDSDYRGEVIVALINLGKEPFEVTHEMRIAQIVIAPVAQVFIQEVDQLGTTVRGSGGFGSTGLV